MSYKSKYTGQEIDAGIDIVMTGTNPTGTIISFMGTIAPDGYLICDGSTKNISDYTTLANFFEAQFGSKNYFGGDGTTTFGLPDLRDEFLRGYHGENNEQKSGNIGIHQDGTQHPRNVCSHRYHVFQTQTDDGKEWTDFDTTFDSEIPAVGNKRFENVTITASAESYPHGTIAYTSRPTNVAVLFCIKY